MFEVRVFSLAFRCCGGTIVSDGNFMLQECLAQVVHDVLHLFGIFTNHQGNQAQAQ
jgi:hypothetical protein